MKPVYLIHILQFTSILIWPKSANKHDTTTLRHDNVHVLRFQYWCNSLSQIINSVLKQDNFLPWLDFFKMSNICTKLETFYPADFSSKERVELIFNNAEVTAISWSKASWSIIGHVGQAQFWTYKSHVSLKFKHSFPSPLLAFVPLCHVGLDPFELWNIVF